jgi:hypothetical protein
MNILDINGVEHSIESSEQICGIEFDTGADVIILTDGRRIGLPKGAYLFGSTESNGGFVLNANSIWERLSYIKDIETKLSRSYFVLSICFGYLISDICYYFIK